MRNRDVLLRTNMCDILKSVQKDLQMYESGCILYLLNNKLLGSKIKMPGTCSNDCDSCIERWMNEESKI